MVEVEGVVGLDEEGLAAGVVFEAEEDAGCLAGAFAEVVGGEGEDGAVEGVGVAEVAGGLGGHGVEFEAGEVGGGGHGGAPVGVPAWAGGGCQGVRCVVSAVR